MSSRVYEWLGNSPWSYWGDGEGGKACARNAEGRVFKFQ